MSAAWLDLTRSPALRRALRNRWPQFLAASAALGGFAFAVTAGLLGTPVGSRNFAIVAVWIAWWAALILLAVPLLGRGWCSICPIPLPGEWLQRGAVLGPGGRGLGLGRRWPRRLRNIWLQNAAFAVLAVFSPVVLTQPLVTGLVLGGLIVLALAASLVFERRAFCRFLCPVGGFLGLYSQLAPLEIRVRDAAVCATHTIKTCYTGSAEGYGCPWQVFPGGLTKNTFCGGCLECVRTCPHDNIAINLRPPGADLMNPSGRRLDEAFKNFLMLGSALVYAAVLLGPWGGLKSAAYSVGTAGWLVYALAFLGLVGVGLPGLFYAAARLSLAGPSAGTFRKAFIAQSYALVPLGLAAWVAFSLSLAFTNLSYLWPALSDPLGWGWDLFATASLSWTPYLSGLVPHLQLAALAGGLGWSAVTARRIAQEPGAGFRAWPSAAGAALVAAALLWLMVG
jgi:polyferredoxin